MKKIRYVWKNRDSDEKMVHFAPLDAKGRERQHIAEHSVVISADGVPVPDEYADRLLTNPRYAGWFEEVPSTSDGPPPAFQCEICGQPMKSKAGLGSHMRIHKQTQRGENETDS